jgi:hypothetical protein
LGFEWSVMVLLLAMLLIAQLWAWWRPVDPRGHAVALNASLVAYFALVSWIIVLATLSL